MANTYEIPTSTGYKTVKAGSKQDAISSVTNKGYTPTLNTGMVPTPQVGFNQATQPTPYTTPTAPDFNVPKKETIPSNYLVGGQSMNDLLSRRRQLEMDVLTANKPTAIEQDLTQQLKEQKQLSRQAQLALNRESERLQTSAGGLTQGITQNFLSETGRRFTNRLADIGVSQSGIADALETEINKRKANVDFATGLLTADKESLALISDLQKMTRPDVLSTQVNDMTGDVTAFTQDPTTGAITSNVIGNVGAKKQYAQSGTYQDASGNQVFWGLTPTGQIETKNLGGGGGLGGGMGIGGGIAGGQYGQALDVILGSGKFTKDQTGAIKRAIATGQDPVTVIKNQAKSLLGQTGDTKLTNYEIAKDQLISVDNALKQFYANGGDTGLLKGSYEKVINRLGEVKDPKLVEIATEIQSALQIYRNAVSGTAYSVQEGADIASIFPGINKSEGLNQAIIKGRMKAFDATIDSTYRSVLGNAYDTLKQANTTQPQQPAIDKEQIFNEEMQQKKPSGFLGGIKSFFSSLMGN